MTEHFSGYLRSCDQAFSGVVLGPVTKHFSGCLRSFDHASCFGSFDRWGILGGINGGEILEVRGA